METILLPLIFGAIIVGGLIALAFAVWDLRLSMKVKDKLRKRIQLAKTEPLHAGQYQRLHRLMQGRRSDLVINEADLFLNRLMADFSDEEVRLIYRGLRQDDEYGRWSYARDLLLG